MNKCMCIGIFLLLLGCQKEGILSFEQAKDGIQFNYNPNGDEMTLNYDFAFQAIEQRDKYNRVTYIYLGDSITVDTIPLCVSLLGEASDVDREFKLKAVPLDLVEELPLGEVKFLPQYIFRANQLLDTVQVVLVRPKSRGKYAVGITFDLEEGNAAFSSGVEEQNLYKVIISDRYEKPENWDECKNALGEFSEEKYAFMVTILHVKYSPSLDWGAYNVVLREKLAEYNQNHPNALKDFDFPIWTKPDWWDWWNGAGTYLGEFSEAKKEFVISVVGEENYSCWTEWANFMPQLREAYDAYNAAHPNSPLPFDPFPENPEE